ncbi:MAG: transcription termination/antitermination factor NusG [Phycisphaerales bacterium]|nr:transcription termination/antitermination factor NusG [Phycisphaerales bacterium]MCB9862974.1 transcription termination/antitermination factor NusG [Phycisphaerales bacterium]
MADDLNQADDGMQDDTQDAAAVSTSASAAGAAKAPEFKSGEGLFREGMQWYVLRVASNREDQVCTSLMRKVEIEGLSERIGRILVPTQREKRMRGGVAKVYDKKLYPGYVFVEMAVEEDGSIPEDIWFMIKETMSVGDFIGSDGKPTPMKPHDVEKMLAVVEKASEQPTLSGMSGMKKGDAIKVKEGPFENFEGEIDEVFPDKGQVRVIVSIFGRPTPIELEYWQVELTTEE